MSIRPAHLAALALACTPPSSGSSGSHTSNGDHSTSSTTIATDDTPTGGTVSATLATHPDTGPTSTATTQDPSTSAADTLPDGTFIVEQDHAPGTFCDWFAQDCDAGEKCMPLAQGVVSYAGEPVCVPLVPDPQPLGGACMILGQPWIDDCAPGLVCLEVNGEGFGTCRQICLQYDQQIPCDMPDTVCLGPHCESCTTLFCQPVCDPLDPLACIVGMLCLYEGYCIFDASGDEGQAGDPCEYINVCDPGLLCLPADAVPGCADPSGCCAPYCDVDDPDCPDADLGVTCIPFYEAGQAPADALADLGFCSLPP